MKAATPFSIGDARGDGSRHDFSGRKLSASGYYWNKVQPAPISVIERRIYLIRGEKVILDAGLAELYQVPTKRLNEAVKRI